MKKVTVVVRIRPKIGEEEKGEDLRVVSRKNRIHILRTQKDYMGIEKRKIKSFKSFDHVYLGSNQIYIYHHIGEKALSACVDRCHNSTVFAYGQTGSGKTFTMLGGRNTKGKPHFVSLFDNYGPLFHIFPVELVNHIHQFVSEYADLTNHGLIPRICRSLFLRLSCKYEHYEVRVRFVEVYNDKTRDLLPVNGKNLKFKRGTVKATHTQVRVTNAESVLVENYEEVMKYLQRGLRRRITKATKGNETSSRSHAIFTLFVKTFSGEGNRVFQERKINLVDLAGSEKYSKKNYSRERQKEGKFINSSLLELGRSLGIASKKHLKKKNKKKKGRRGKKRNKQFVPVRSNLLTLLLKDSLGGVSETFMIANCSPCIKDVNESFCTLNYANRCKHIRLSVKKARVGDYSKEYPTELRRKMTHLCKQVQKKHDILRNFQNVRWKAQEMAFKLKKDVPKILIDETIFGETYDQARKNIHVTALGIQKFLKKLLEKFEKESINCSLLSSLESVGLTYDSKIIGDAIDVFDNMYNSSFWDYREFVHTLHKRRKLLRKMDYEGGEIYYDPIRRRMEDRRSLPACASENYDPSSRRRSGKKKKRKKKRPKTAFGGDKKKNDEKENNQYNIYGTTPSSTNNIRSQVQLNRFLLKNKKKKKKKNKNIYNNNINKKDRKKKINLKRIIEEEEEDDDDVYSTAVDFYGGELKTKEYFGSKKKRKSQQRTFEKFRLPNIELSEHHQDNNLLNISSSSTTTSSRSSSSYSSSHSTDTDEEGEGEEEDDENTYNYRKSSRKIQKWKRYDRSNEMSEFPSLYDF